MELNWIKLNKNRIELNLIELNWIELNWIELNQIKWSSNVELNWIELNQIKLRRNQKDYNRIIGEQTWELQQWTKETTSKRNRWEMKGLNSVEIEKYKKSGETKKRSKK